jgi:4-hydroxy-3-methylbut-2-en-1-yl diphosphate reductase
MAQAPPLTIVTALRLEALAIGGPVVRMGMGPVKAGATGSRLVDTLPPGQPLAVVGIAGGLEAGLLPGQLVVADALCPPDGAEPIPLAQAEAVAAALRRHGRDVRIGAVACSTTIVHGAARASLAAGGALAVEMESVWLARHVGHHPLAVVRAVGDTEHHGFVSGNLKALAALRHLRPALEQWAHNLSASGPTAGP